MPALTAEEMKKMAGAGRYLEMPKQENLPTNCKNCAGILAELKDGCCSYCGTRYLPSRAKHEAAQEYIPQPPSPGVLADISAVYPRRRLEQMLEAPVFRPWLSAR